MSTRQDVSVMKRSLRKKQKREFSGGPVIRIWCFYCQGQAPFLVQQLRSRRATHVSRFMRRDQEFSQAG